MIGEKEAKIVQIVAEKETEKNGVEVLGPNKKWESQKNGGRLDK